MSVDAKFRAALAPHLSDGEEMQVAFVAQRIPPWLPLFLWWLPLFARTRIVAATDQRLLVCVCERHLLRVVVAEVEREIPRRTRIGPPRGRWHRSSSLGLYVGRPYFDEVRTADKLAGFQD